MKNKELFLKAVSTLLYSWGGDTPPEATWGLNDLLKWYEAEYNVKLGVKFTEVGSKESTDNEVIAAIKEK